VDAPGDLQKQAWSTICVIAHLDNGMIVLRSPKRAFLAPATQLTKTSRTIGTRLDRIHRKDINCRRRLHQSPKARELPQRMLWRTDLY
jgi:hypothetical protein